jgi:N-acetylglucosaminyl-diphospho-decaprenol L-rhamnosyltransferase
MTASVAVITVTHNSSHVIEGWVDALEQTGHRSRMQLCVVDSGSTSEERRFLTERVQERVDVLCERPNLGYGRSCNAGAEHTAAPMLLFTNPDTRLRSLPEGIWDGERPAGRILGAFKLGEGGLKPLGFSSYPTAAWEVRELVFGHWRRGIERSPKSPAWVSGAALLISGKDFTRIGGFSPELFLYFEDADLCARHRAAGGTVALDPAFLVEHGARQSSAVEDPDRLRSALDSVNRLSARTFAARHGRGWHRPLLYGLLVVAYLPRRVVSALLGRRGRRARAVSYALDLLTPRRAMRRLGAP